MWSGQEGLVEEQDLHLFRSPYIIRILYGLVGALAGWFGTIYLSLGLGFLSIDLAWAVAFVMATYGYGRNFLLKHVLIGRKYRTVFLFAWLNRYVVFVSLVFYSLTAPQLFLIPDFFSRPILQTLGLSYLFLGLTFQWMSPLEYLKEGGLSLLYYLQVRKSKGLSKFSWLRRGLHRVEKQLTDLGISVPKGTLSMGATQGILNGTRLNEELRSLGDWLRKPANQTPWPSIDAILFQAAKARWSGSIPSRTWEDRVSIIGQNIGTIATSVLTIVNLAVLVWKLLHP